MQLVSVDGAIGDRAQQALLLIQHKGDLVRDMLNDAYGLMHRSGWRQLEKMEINYHRE